MKQFLTLLTKDLMELWRTKKVLIIAAVFIIFALASPILAKLLPEILSSMSLSATSEVKVDLPAATIIDSYAQFVSNLCQLGIFTVIIACGGLIANERKKGIYHNLLNNGVKKTNFLLAKVVAQIIVVSVIYIISCLLFSAYNYVLFDAFMVKYSLLAFLAFYIYTLFVIIILNFYSTVVKSNVTSIILSLANILLIPLFDLFAFGKYLPNYLLNITTNIIKDATLLDYAYLNMGITIILSGLIFMLSIKLCRTRE